MFGVQDQADVKGPLHGFRRRFAVEDAQEVARHRLGGIGSNQLQSFAMPIKVGNQGGRPCGQTERLSQVGLGRTIVTLGVKVGLGGHQGAKGMHRRGVGWQRFEHVHQTIRNGHRGLEFLGERGQLVSIGETLVPQEEAALFKGGVSGQAVNVDADVFQDPLFTINEAHHTVGHHHVGKTFVDEGTGERFGSSAHKGVRR